MTGPNAFAEFGTFDVENYGDLLYPILFEKMARIRGWSGDTHKFSLVGSHSLQDSRYQSQPIRDLYRSRPNPPFRAFVVGGGDLLRTDWPVLASHYSRVPLAPDSALPLLPRLKARIFRRPLDHATRFRHHFAPYPAAGPFLIDPSRFPGLGPIAYCSCGVPFPFDASVSRRVARALNQSAFIYVRDRRSKNSLVAAGVQREIHFAPDLAVVLSDFFDSAAERVKGRELLRNSGVDITRPVLCVQSNPQPPVNRLQLLNQLLAWQKGARASIFLLPLARCHGDHEYLEQLAKESHGAFHYLAPDSIFDILSLLAACDLFLGTSLHGNVTAFSFGIPHLFGPIPAAKTEGFLEAVDLPRDLKLHSWAATTQKLGELSTMDRALLSSRAAAAKRRVHETFDLLLRAINK